MDYNALPEPEYSFSEFGDRAQEISYLFQTVSGLEESMAVDIGVDTAYDAFINYFMTVAIREPAFYERVISACNRRTVDGYTGGSRFFTEQNLGSGFLTDLRLAATRAAPENDRPQQ